MRRKGHSFRWLPGAILAAAFAFSTPGCIAAPEAEPFPGAPQQAASRDTSSKPLPRVLVAVLREVKAKSRIPVLLPSELPEPIVKASHALVGKATASRYAIGLYYELGVGDAGFAALFMAQARPSYHAQELANVRKVRLAHGILGFFRPVSCGGSCAPANLWWEVGPVLYQIQFKLSPTVNQRAQEEAIVAAANSAILAGPR